MVGLRARGPRRRPPTRQIEVLGHDADGGHQRLGLECAHTDEPSQDLRCGPKPHDQDASIRATVDLVVEVVDALDRRLMKELPEHALRSDEGGEPPATRQGAQRREDPEVAGSGVLREEEGGAGEGRPDDPEDENER